MPEGPEYSRPRNAWRDSEERAFAAGWGGCREAGRDSVACGLPESSAVVVTAEEFVGLGVDGDEFAVAPDSWVVFVGYGEAIDGVAHGFELVGYVYGKFLFEVDAVGEVLVVEARGVGSLLDVEAV